MSCDCCQRLGPGPYYPYRSKEEYEQAQNRLVKEIVEAIQRRETNMGHFRIEINGVGGHGCSREYGNGEFVQGCGQPTCLDCMAREFVRKLKAAGVFSNLPASATFTHWPGTAEAVKDNLLTGIRTGQWNGGFGILGSGQEA